MHTKTAPAQKKEEETPFYKFFNLKRIADLSQIHPDKLYNNFNGFYKSMSSEDKDQVAGILMPQIKALFGYLGYAISFTKQKGK